MNEELLISLVQKYRELYDLGDPRYHDEQRRMNIWQEIAQILNETPANCKERWKRIRDNYRRAKKLRVTKSGQAATNIEPIRFEKELSFLSPFICNDIQQNSTNLPSLSDDEQVLSPRSATDSQAMSPLSSNSSSVMSPPPISRSQVSKTDLSRITKKKKTDRISQSPPPTQTLFQSYLEKKYQSLNQCHDTMVDFFTNLGKTVTTFPKDVQIRVKGAVFKIVNDAEADLFCRQVDTNNISHASRESQNMQTINQHNCYCGMLMLTLLGITNKYD
ncbi:unnamed protein product [Arctia plantaginis]|uniref:MADF domain-containing protein n=1 Tax=Arctia plantaginis TaxID=874455 RepID=A0A8S0ZHP6_ARCPL|nr:unnamed protein product [Arctia plantaginis]